MWLTDTKSETPTPINRLCKIPRLRGRMCQDFSFFRGPFTTPSIGITYKNNNINKKANQTKTQEAIKSYFKWDTSLSFTGDPGGAGMAGSLGIGDIRPCPLLSPLPSESKLCPSPSSSLLSPVSRILSCSEAELSEAFTSNKAFCRHIQANSSVQAGIAAEWLTLFCLQLIKQTQKLLYQWQAFSTLSVSNSL